MASTNLGEYLSMVGPFLTQLEGELSNLHIKALDRVIYQGNSEFHMDVSAKSLAAIMRQGLLGLG